MIFSRTEMMIESNNISRKNENPGLESSDKENKMNKVRNMQVNNRRLGSCRGICENYRGTKHPSGWYANGQVRCTGCMNFLTPKGVELRNGRKLCKCCHSNVRTRPHGNWSEKEHTILNQNESDQKFEYPIEGEDEIEENFEPSKKETPAYFEETTDKRNYYELREFIEDSIRLQANYQLVMLKYLVSHKKAHKGEISE